MYKKCLVMKNASTGTNSFLKLAIQQQRRTFHGTNTVRNIEFNQEEVRCRVHSLVRAYRTHGHVCNTIQCNYTHLLIQRHTIVGSNIGSIRSTNTEKVCLSQLLLLK
jgi:hypothetical protein